MASTGGVGGSSNSKGTGNSGGSRGTSSSGGSQKNGGSQSTGNSTSSGSGVNSKDKGGRVTSSSGQNNGVNSKDKGGRVTSTDKKGTVSTDKGSRVTSDNISLSPDAQADPKTQEATEKAAEEAAQNFESRFNASAQTPEESQEALANALESKADQVRQQEAGPSEEGRLSEVAEGLEDKAEGVRAGEQVNDAAGDFKTLGRSVSEHADKLSDRSKAASRARDGFAAGGIAGSTIQGYNSTTAAAEHFANGEYLDGVAQSTSAISDGTDIAGDLAASRRPGGITSTLGRASTSAGNLAKLTEAATEFREGRYMEATGTAVVAGGGLIAENSKNLSKLATKAAPVIGAVEGAATLADDTQNSWDRLAGGMKVAAFGVGAAGATSIIGAAPAALVAGGLQVTAMGIENRELVGQGALAVGRSLAEPFTTKPLRSPNYREIENQSLREMSHIAFREQSNPQRGPDGLPTEIDISEWYTGPEVGW